jgi:hypothetical protein
VAVVWRNEINEEVPLHVCLVHSPGGDERGGDSQHKSSLSHWDPASDRTTSWRSPGKREDKRVKRSP